jgi:hypothetical protein
MVVPNMIASNMVASETFAGILSIQEGPDHESASARVVTLDEWRRSRLANRSDLVTASIPTGSATEAGTIKAMTTDRVGSGTEDMLDADFIDFHRGLKEYMMDAYGLMGFSEATDFHAVIARHVRVADPSGAHA